MYTALNADKQALKGNLRIVDKRGRSEKGPAMQGLKSD